MPDSNLTAIFNQPAVWRDALAEFSRQDPALSGFFDHVAPDKLLFVGSGSSFAVAQTAAAVARRVIGIDAEAHAAADVWLFPRETITPKQRTLMVVISRSGTTSAILNALDSFAEECDAAGANADAVAITCRANSPLATRVQPALIAHAAQNLISAIPALQILTHSLIYSFAGQAISERFRRLPALCEELLATQQTFARGFASAYRPDQQVIFLGCGSLYGTADAARHAYATLTGRPAELRHSMEPAPAFVGSHPLVIGLLSKAAADHEAALLTDFKGSGARILALTPKPLPALAAAEQIILPDKLSDYERAPLYLPLIHLIACYQARM